MIFIFKFRAIIQTFAIKDHEIQRSQWKREKSGKDRSCQDIQLFLQPLQRLASEKTEENPASPNQVGFSNI